MKNQNFGIEIEMTGITRATASKVVAGYFHTTAIHVGGVYDAYSVRDSDNRQWKIMSDASIRCENRNGNSASRLYAVEFVVVKTATATVPADCMQWNLLLQSVITMTSKRCRSL